MSETKHYIDHYEVDESTYGEYIQDGSTGGLRKRVIKDGENKQDGKNSTSDS